RHAHNCWQPVERRALRRGRSAHPPGVTDLATTQAIGRAPATGGLIAADSASTRPSAGLMTLARRRLPHDYLALGAALLLVGYAALALAAQLIASQVMHTTPTTIDMRNVFLPPSFSHWLGTDDFGRDQFVRLLYGARVSLSIGLLAGAVNLSIGVS